jgi:hypothetical protein
VINPDFLKAIEMKKYVKVTFFSKKDNAVVTKRYVPLDYGPSKNEKVPTDRYHFYNVEDPKGFYTISVLPENVQAIEITEDVFNPTEFIKWTPVVWILPRNW